MEKHQIVKALEEFHLKLLNQPSLQREIDFLESKIDEQMVVGAVGVLDEEERYDTWFVALDLKEKLVCRCWSNWMDPQILIFFEEFTMDEILEGTDSFNLSSRLGEGSFGDTYKAVLRRTKTAIKVPSLHNLNRGRDLQHTYEIHKLSKMRHPKIVPLLGVCRELSALVYEYVPNGNLSERLACKGNTPPLSWQRRISIASEICSALIYLHSCQPEGIIHGDLKPSNVLLDGNLGCKLADFGICSKVYNSKVSSSEMFYRTDPDGTSSYIVPEIISHQKLTTKSDVYCFGIMLLHLLTGKSKLTLKDEVMKAVNKDNLISILDTSAGVWPLEQANELAVWGLKCCKEDWMQRPNLNVDVWNVVERARIFSESSSSSSPYPGSNKDDAIPFHFKCPITQDVMKDPRVAADGFTYEARALQSWLDRGHVTSPMTNLRLESLHLVPNLTLRSAIQEWKEQHP